MAGRQFNANQAQRRIISTVQRVESEPRSYTPPRRMPRLTGDSVSVLSCVPSASIPAATGTPPSDTPGSLTSQTIYGFDGSAYVAISGTFTVFNPFGNAFASGKRTLVFPVNSGYMVIDQSC